MNFKNLFKKKIELPVKNKISEYEILRSMKIRSKKDIWERIKKEEEMLMIEKRYRNFQGQRYQEGQLEILNWITNTNYGNTQN